MLARDNPFRSERLHALGYLSVDDRGICRSPDLQDLVQRVLALRRCAVVGPHGSGKTTLVLGLAAALRASGREVRFVHLSREAGRLSREWRGLLVAPPNRGQVVLLDGGGELAWPLFARVAFACRNARA